MEEENIASFFAYMLAYNVQFYYVHYNDTSPKL